jgi:hypothetical protein
MKLSAIEYKLDEYELPDHIYLTGALDIEIDRVSGDPYIWAFQLDVWNAATDTTVKYEFTSGAKDNHPNAIAMQHDLHRDRKLMDNIFDECAREGMWDE